MNIGNQEYWDSFKKVLINEYGQELYETFFINSKFENLIDGKYLVCFQNQVASVICNNHFKDKIEALMYNSTGIMIDFEAKVIAKNDQKKTNESITELSDEQKKWYDNNKPNEQLTFEKFVQGESNLKALRAAKAVSFNGSNLEINPLFIYGDSGLGKTHLLNAIGNEFLKHNPNLKVVYISANDFVNGYVSSLGYVASYGSETNLNTFTKNFLSADVLLLDDVQSFNSKTETSETFFNIFNYLVNKNKKIIIASDKPPKQLKGIEERLITRFNQGMSVPVLKPGSALAVAFLRKKLLISFRENPDLVITDEVFEYFALNFGSDFRSLNEIINSISFQVTIIPTNEINMDYIKNHLGHKIQNNNKNTWKNIIDHVGEYHQIFDVSLLLSKSRKKDIVLARNCAVWLIRKHLNLSYKQIGNIFSGRDHSTIMHSITKINNLIKTNGKMKEMISDLESKALLKT